MAGGWNSYCEGILCCWKGDIGGRGADCTELSIVRLY